MKYKAAARVWEVLLLYFSIAFYFIGINWLFTDQSFLCGNVSYMYECTCTFVSCHDSLDYIVKIDDDDDDVKLFTM